MHRRYNRWWGRFNQPDPSDGSYDLGDPQSLNRYSYVQNDPVNYVDPSGLNAESSGGGSSCWVSWVGTNWYQGDEYLRTTNFRITSITCTGGWGEQQTNPFPPEVQTPPLDNLRLPTPSGLRCGVNPITGEPGFTRNPTGIAGNLRPGVGGGGDFGDRRRATPAGHQGLDISGISGASSIYANRAGTVTFAGVAGAAGNLIIIDHGGGVSTRYGHNSSNLVSAGTRVSEGQEIGIVGQTGNARGQALSEAHVHFGVRINGTNVDPANYLNFMCPQG